MWWRKRKKAGIWWQNSGAARGHRGHVTPPPSHVEGPAFVRFFLQNCTKNVLSYFQNEMAEIRGENWYWGPWEVRWPFTGILTFFSAKIYKKNVYHICKMKWPKSEENIKIAGAEKLGGRRACPLPHCKCLAAPLWRKRQCFIHDTMNVSSNMCPGPE